MNLSIDIPSNTSKDKDKQTINSESPTTAVNGEATAAPLTKEVVDSAGSASESNPLPSATRRKASKKRSEAAAKLFIQTTQSPPQAVLERSKSDTPLTAIDSPSLFSSTADTSIQSEGRRTINLSHSMRKQDDVGFTPIEAQASSLKKSNSLKGISPILIEPAPDTTTDVLDLRSASLKRRQSNLSPSNKTRSSLTDDKDEALQSASATDKISPSETSGQGASERTLKRITSKGPAAFANLSASANLSVSFRKPSEPSTTGLLSPGTASLNVSMNSNASSLFEYDSDNAIQQLLYTLPFFSGSSNSHAFIKELSNDIKIRKYKPGDSIIQFGDIAKSMFLILRGDLAIVSEDNETTYAVLSAGSFGIF